MSYQKELLTDLIKDWTLQQLDDYIVQLHTKQVELNEWLKEVQAIRRKKTPKKPVDTGTRGGIG